MFIPSRENLRRLGRIVYFGPKNQDAARRAIESRRGGAVPPTSDQGKEVLATLRRDGVCAIPDFMPRDWCLALGPKLWQLYEDMTQGKLPPGTKFQYAPTDPHNRIMGIDKLVPETADFFDHPLIGEMARAYVDRNIREHHRMVDFRVGVGKVSGADTVHIDEARFWPKFKAFLYLQDVDEGNGPFVYYPGSHVDAPWRARKEAEIFEDGEEGPWGHFTPNEVWALEKKHGYKATPMTGRAGTMLFVDTTGLHNASPLQHGTRMMLGSYFEM